MARTTFDTALATEVAGRARACLAKAGFSVVGPEALVTNVEELTSVAQQLANKPIDLLLVFQATFADTTMVMRLVQAVEADRNGTRSHGGLLLWAVPEARSGGRLRLNSFCGVNLAAHALTREGIHYDYLYAAPDEPANVEHVRTLALAGRARRLLHQARVGRLGNHPDGLDSCRFDGKALQSHFGLEIVQVNLESIFQAVRMLESREVEAVYQDLTTRLDDLDALDQAALRRTLGSYIVMRQLADRMHLDGMAVRCWPEFFTELGCAACGAMSMLSDQLIPCSCEADVNGTITQLVLQWLGGGPAFGTDLVSIDVNEDVVVLWHCGLAPLSMADPAVQPRGTIHSNRQLPLLMEFPLKPGRVTVARLSEATGGYRLVVGGGEMLQAPMSFTGTSGVMRFDRPANEVLDTLLGEGLEHHLSLTYGDHMPALLALAKMLDLPVLRLS